jgi:hypothetical protein
MMFGSFRDLAFMGAALEAPPAPGLDPDAAAYIAAVEDTDGQALEAAVVDAIDAFVVGCKADGIWTAIKASCILAGARTLAGALVPLAGTAPTSFNFVDGDYNRKTGLVGDGSTKYLDSNRNNNADPQNNNHNAVWLSTYTSGDQYLIGSGSIAGSNFALARSNAAFFRHRYDNTSNTESFAATGAQFSGGLFGMSRALSNVVNVSYRQNAGQVFSSNTEGSSFPANANVSLFRVGLPYSNTRLAFYSIGESLDLALLDARVTDLINAFDTAIPS